MNAKLHLVSPSNPVALLVAGLVWVAASDSRADAIAPPVSGAPDPATGEISLPGTGGWNAFLILDNAGVPLWTVEPADVFDSHGCPEIVGLDDKGHTHVCVSYSGRWTPTRLIADPKWLGGFAHADIDPRLAGAETYIGAQSGNLYQIVAWPNLILDYRLIASLPGREIHILAAGQLDPSTPAGEVIAFTVPGGVFLISPTGPNGTFEWKHLGDYVGRVRQALILAPVEGEPPTIVTASRNGRLDLLRIQNGQLAWESIYETAMGMGRVALRPPCVGQPMTLYSTLDDGRILRHERQAGRAWITEVIYNGPQGPRGIIAGQFDADPATETVAIFGYSKKVELLSRRSGIWSVETIFADQEKGHWLAAAELDGRNNTSEIVATGYGGRIVYLSRPPGYGRTELASGATAASRVVMATFDQSPLGDLPTGWESATTGVGRPEWSVAQDPSAPSQPRVLRQSGVADYALCVWTNTRAQNGFAEVQFKPVSGEKDQAGGLVWRYQDSDNYYVCRGNALENNVVLYKVQAGKRTPLPIIGRATGYGVNAPVLARAWNRLRVEFTGARHKVLLNGSTLFEVEDGTFGEAGFVGLWTKADSQTLFDDVVVGQAQ